MTGDLNISVRPSPRYTEVDISNRVGSNARFSINLQSKNYNGHDTSVSARMDSTSIFLINPGEKKSGVFLKLIPGGHFFARKKIALGVLFAAGQAGSLFGYFLYKNKVNDYRNRAATTQSFNLIRAYNQRANDNNRAATRLAILSGTIYLTNLIYGFLYRPYLRDSAKKNYQIKPLVNGNQIGLTLNF